jgi:hypothetical protein
MRRLPMKRRHHQTPNVAMKTSVSCLSYGILLAAFFGAVQASDDDRYTNSALTPWFDSLKSGNNPCCSDADGFAVSGPDWESKDGHYLSGSITDGSTFPTMP